MTFGMGLPLAISAVSISLVIGAAFSADATAEQSNNPVVVIETTMGDITVELFKDKAPKSVDNFLAYAKDNFYRGTVFHRVIKGFMIQGGGLTQSMGRKPTKPAIENEAANGLKNKRGTLAMARTGEINSATAQFFINTVNNGFLDHKGKSPDKFGYAVFAKVIDGMDVVDKIENVKTATKGMYKDVPEEAVVIKAVRVKS